MTNLEHMLKESYSLADKIGTRVSFTKSSTLIRVPQTTTGKEEWTKAAQAIAFSVNAPLEIMLDAYIIRTKVLWWKFFAFAEHLEE